MTQITKASLLAGPSRGGVLSGGYDKLDPMPLDPRLLEILCCPACHGELAETAEGLHCQGCGLLYPIEDGIPVMLVDQAKKEAQ